MSHSSGKSAGGGSGGADGAYPWSASVSYPINALVRFSGLTYISIAGSNLNNAPTGTATDNAFWFFTTVGVNGGTAVY
jgi:hypothetical protein